MFQAIVFEQGQRSGQRFDLLNYVRVNYGFSIVVSVSGSLLPEPINIKTEEIAVVGTFGLQRGVERAGTPTP